METRFALIPAVQDREPVNIADGSQFQQRVCANVRHCGPDSRGQTRILGRSPHLTRSCANASIVVRPWNFSVPGLSKWIQPELKLFTISM